MAQSEHAATRRVAITVVAALLALGAAWYLCNVAVRVAGDAGYDFRYIWLAGRLWLDGLSPYLAGYQETGAALIDRGNVPELWVYPPNWWTICTVLGLVGLAEANVLWNLTGVGLAALSSRLTVAACVRCRWDVLRLFPGFGNVLGWGSVPVFAHFFGTAALEATALSLAIGQTSLLMLFGVALLLHGVSRASLPFAAAGLSLVLLKPQVGIVFLFVLPILGGWARRIVLGAVAISAALALPAAIVDPSVLLHFVRNIAAYDGYTDANLPQAMTGLRLVTWEMLGRDIGNIGAVIATVSVALLLVGRAVRRAGDVEPHVLVWRVVTLTVAVIVAIAPLHYYDFVMAVTLMPAFLLARGVALAAGVLGAALILRADWLGKVMGLHDPEVPIFEGSIVATVGGVLLLIATHSALSRGQDPRGTLPARSPIVTQRIRTPEVRAAAVRG